MHVVLSSIIGRTIIHPNIVLCMTYNVNGIANSRANQKFHKIKSRNEVFVAIICVFVLMVPSFICPFIGEELSTNTVIAM